MPASKRISHALAATVVGALAFGLTFGGTAQAAGCAQVSISPGVQSPALSPNPATIVAGGCAAYTNKTALPVKVAVGKLSGVVNQNAAITFREPAPGTFAVTAQEQFQGQGVGGTGHGTLVVKPRPAPKPSPQPSTTSASPHPSASSAPPSATPTSSGPVVATVSPTQAPPTTPGLTPAPNQSGQGNPPVIVGIPPPTPTPSSSSSPEIVDRAQLQPPSGRATGLPAAIAALLIVGAGAAFVRVLLAEPVHDGRFVPRAS